MQVEHRRQEGAQYLMDLAPLLGGIMKSGLGGAVLLLEALEDRELMSARSPKVTELPVRHGETSSRT